MRLLIVTQAVDTNNSVLGFFHGWLQAFAKDYEHIDVICLEKGAYNLPNNVQVYSLGKEQWHASRFAYTFRFWKHIIQLRRDYDAVLVHMNEEYVVLGGLLWMVWGKPIYLWRNHKEGSWRTNIAMIFAKKLLCTSPQAYVAKSKKAVQMPVGIDTNVFTFINVTRSERSILSLGRLAPVKRLEVMLESLNMLQKRSINFSADIYGDALSKDESYLQGLKKYTRENNLTKVTFKPGIANNKTPVLYASHEVFVNLTNTGSFDKTIFEAMACGSLVVVSNKALQNIVPEELFFKEYDPVSLTDALSRSLALPESTKAHYRQKLQAYVLEHHSLLSLAKRLKGLIGGQ